MPVGETADEGYVVIRDALKATGKVAVGQMIMGGSAHIVGIKPHEKGASFSVMATKNDGSNVANQFHTEARQA